MCLTITSLEYPELREPGRAYKVVEYDKKRGYISPIRREKITYFYRASGPGHYLNIGSVIKYVIHVFPDRESAETYRNILSEAFEDSAFVTLPCNVRKEYFVAAGTTAITHEDRVFVLPSLGFTQVSFPIFESDESEL